MTDLKDLLNERANRSTPVGSEKLRQRVAFTLASASRRYLAGADRHRLAGLQVAFTAAAVVVLVLAVVVLLDPFGADEFTVIEDPTTVSATTEPAPATTDVTPTTTGPATASSVPAPIEPGTVPASLEMTWTRVVGGDALEDGWMTTVVAGGPGLVAGGYVYLDGLPDPNDSLLGPIGLTTPAIWVSADGLAWERIDQPEVFDASPGIVTEIFSGVDGVFALGFEGTMPGADQVMWASTDGFEWIRLEDWPYLTISGPQGLSWISIDGGNWHRGPGTRQWNGQERAATLDIVAGGPGYVAVGWAGANAASGVEAGSAIWTSEDGSNWQQVPDMFGGHYFERIAAGPQGTPLIAFGDDGPLISDDGFTWQDSIGIVDELPAPGSEVAWDEDRVVVAGLTYRGDTADLWASEDGGRTFHHISGDLPELTAYHTEATDIVTFDTGFVAVGGDGATGNWYHYGDHPLVTDPVGRAAVWIGHWTTDD